MANNSISLVNLDFDTLKNQLKTYLKSQAKFSDYDFDGSNMSVLLDILTYNSHLNAFYLNMVASEMFLDSAQLRNSVLSHAKALNYVPRSVKSARAVVSLRFNQSGLTSFSVPENTRFTGKNSRGSYEFRTNESLVLYPTGGAFIANNVTIFQGSNINNAFVVNYAIENQRFVLSNSDIDTDSIQVNVLEDGLENLTYTRATTLYDVKSDSKVYFLQASEDTKYEIVFGDGVLGRKPKDGAIITCTYRISAGPAGNETTNFILADNLGAINGFGSAIIPTITTVTAGFGGGEAETIEDIRTRAPRFYQTQERAITTNDFATLTTQEFQYIKNVHVYGGDTNGLFQYGKVFIAPITFTGELTSQADKDQIQTFLKPKATIGITPVVVDPDYLYVGVECEALYTAASTTLSAIDIQTKIKNAIALYNTNQLTDFNSEFKTSRFEAAIDDSDPSISSNDTNIILRKTFRSELFVRTFPTIQFRNEIVPGTLTSSSFIANGRRYQYTDFNPNNNTFSVTQVDNKAVINNTTNTIYLKDITLTGSVSYVSAGTIDYKNGSISINAITPTSYEGSAGIDFTARPVSENVTSSQNDVIAIDPDYIIINVKQI
jgi:hypothetical protein